MGAPSTPSTPLVKDVLDFCQEKSLTGAACDALVATAKSLCNATMAILVALTFSNGASVVYTGSHPFYVPARDEWAAFTPTCDAGGTALRPSFGIGDALLVAVDVVLHQAHPPAAPEGHVAHRADPALEHQLRAALGDVVAHRLVIIRAPFQTVGQR